jgi:hypothetical protein
MLLNNPAPHGDPLAMPKANAGDSSTVPQPLQPQNERAALIKDLKAAGGIIEAPRRLVRILGDLDAACFLWEVMKAGDALALSNMEFSERLCLGLDPFRYLRAKLEKARLISHNRKHISGKVTPTYTFNLQAFLEEKARVEAGGIPRFIKYVPFSDVSQMSNPKHLGIDPQMLRPMDLGTESQMGAPTPSHPQMSNLMDLGTRPPNVESNGFGNRVPNVGSSTFGNPSVPLPVKIHPGRRKAPPRYGKKSCS